MAASYSTTQSTQSLASLPIAQSTTAAITPPVGVSFLPSSSSSSLTAPTSAFIPPPANAAYPSIYHQPQQQQPLLVPTPLPTPTQTTAMSDAAIGQVAGDPPSLLAAEPSTVIAASPLDRLLSQIEAAAAPPSSSAAASASMPNVMAAPFKTIHRYAAGDTANFAVWYNSMLHRFERQLHLLTFHLSEKTMATAVSVMTPANESYAALIIDDLTAALLALLRAVRQGTEPPLIPAIFVSAASTIALQATIWSAQPMPTSARQAILNRIAFPALNILNYMSTTRLKLPNEWTDGILGIQLAVSARLALRNADRPSSDMSADLWIATVSTILRVILRQSSYDRPVDVRSTIATVRNHFVALVMSAPADYLRAREDFGLVWQSKAVSYTSQQMRGVMPELFQQPDIVPFRSFFFRMFPRKGVFQLVADPIRADLKLPNQLPNRRILTDLLAVLLTGSELFDIGQVSVSEWRPRLLDKATASYVPNCPNRSYALVGPFETSDDLNGMRPHYALLTDRAEFNLREQKGDHQRDIIEQTESRFPTSYMSTNLPPPSEYRIDMLTAAESAIEPNAFAGSVPIVERLKNNNAVNAAVPIPVPPPQIPMPSPYPAGVAVYPNYGYPGQPVAPTAPQMYGGYSGSGSHDNGDESMQSEDEKSAKPKSKRGRPPKSGAVKREQQESASSASDPEVQIIAHKRTRNPAYENVDPLDRKSGARYRCEFCYAAKQWMRSQFYRHDPKKTCRKTPDLIPRDVVRSKLATCVGNKTMARVKPLDGIKHDFPKMVYEAAKPYLTECAKHYTQYCAALEKAKADLIAAGKNFNFACKPPMEWKSQDWYEWSQNEFTPAWLDANLHPDWLPYRIYVPENRSPAQTSPSIPKQPTEPAAAADAGKKTDESKSTADPKTKKTKKTRKLKVKREETPEQTRLLWGIDWSELFTFLINPWYGILNDLEEYLKFLNEGKINEQSRRGGKKSSSNAATATKKTNQPQQQPEPEPDILSNPYQLSERALKFCERGDWIPLGEGQVKTAHLEGTNLVIEPTQPDQPYMQYEDGTITFATGPLKDIPLNYDIQNGRMIIPTIEADGQPIVDRNQQPVVIKIADIPPARTDFRTETYYQRLRINGILAAKPMFQPDIRYDALAMFLQFDYTDFNNPNRQPLSVQTIDRITIFLAAQFTVASVQSDHPLCIGPNLMPACWTLLKTVLREPAVAWTVERHDAWSRAIIGMHTYAMDYDGDQARQRQTGSLLREFFETRDVHSWMTGESGWPSCFGAPPSTAKNGTTFEALHPRDPNNFGVDNGCAIVLERLVLQQHFFDPAKTVPPTPFCDSLRNAGRPKLPRLDMYSNAYAHTAQIGIRNPLSPADPFVAEVPQRRLLAVAGAIDLTVRQTILPYLSMLRDLRQTAVNSGTNNMDTKTDDLFCNDSKTEGQSWSTLLKTASWSLSASVCRLACWTPAAVPPTTTDHPERDANRKNAYDMLTVSADPAAALASSNGLLNAAWPPTVLTVAKPTKDRVSLSDYLSVGFGLSTDAAARLERSVLSAVPASAASSSASSSEPEPTYRGTPRRPVDQLAMIRAILTGRPEQSAAVLDGLHHLMAALEQMMAAAVFIDGDGKTESMPASASTIQVAAAAASSLSTDSKHRQQRSLNEGYLRLFSTVYCLRSALWTQQYVDLLQQTGTNRALTCAAATVTALKYDDPPTVGCSWNVGTAPNDFTFIGGTDGSQIEMLYGEVDMKTSYEQADNFAYVSRTAVPDLYTVWMQDMLLIQRDIMRVDVWTGRMLLPTAEQLSSKLTAAYPAASVSTVSGTDMKSDNRYPTATGSTTAAAPMDDVDDGFTLPVRRQRPTETLPSTQPVPKPAGLPVPVVPKPAALPLPIVPKPAALPVPVVPKPTTMPIPKPSAVPAKKRKTVAKKSVQVAADEQDDETESESESVRPKKKSKTKKSKKKPAAAASESDAEDDAENDEPADDVYDESDAADAAAVEDESDADDESKTVKPVTSSKFGPFSAAGIATMSVRAAAAKAAAKIKLSEQPQPKSPPTPVATKKKKKTVTVKKELESSSSAAAAAETNGRIQKCGGTPGCNFLCSAKGCHGGTEKLACHEKPPKQSVAGGRDINLCLYCRKHCAALGTTGVACDQHKPPRQSKKR